MISNSVLKKGFITLGLALPVLALQGCLATQDMGEGATNTD